jgi:integrase
VREVLQGQFHAGRSIRTLRLAHAVLHRLFETAIEDGVAKANPTPKFAKLYLGDMESEAEGAKRKARTHAQVTALLAATKDLDLRAYIAILATCGLRPGECLGLRWSDVDLKANELHVCGSAKERTEQDGAKRTYVGKTKNTSSVRTIAIGPSLAERLAAERERQEARQRMMQGREANVRDMRSLLPAAACLFPHDDATADGLLRPTDPDNMRARFYRVAKKAGLQTTPHVLRHTAISHAIEGGLSLADAAARAGHASVVTTAKV